MNIFVFLHSQCFSVLPPQLPASSGKDSMSFISWNLPFGVKALCGWAGPVLFLLHTEMRAQKVLAWVVSNVDINDFVIHTIKYTNLMGQLACYGLSQTSETRAQRTTGLDGCPPLWQSRHLHSFLSLSLTWANWCAARCQESRSAKLL